MFKVGLTVVVIVCVVMYGFLLSSYLYEQDTTLSSFLSGAILSLTGFGENDQLLRVNLRNYQFSMYKGGEVYNITRVAATGNPLNSTRTPTGKFRILSKERIHISNLSGAIMPWAMRFYKGYYFHDIPLWPSGEIINTPYSAGCIRLSSALAPEVYTWTQVGARVEIYWAELVKEESNPMVYWLSQDGFRNPIANEVAFTSRNFRWQDVTVIPAAELAALPIGDTLY
ncbi:MAG TPA: L,D-transpeptidase [Candidatus Paceibacterota bacterium]|nr:L,D-transpeptidase [Candidatus Paceibacterota bacterium]